MAKNGFKIDKSLNLKPQTTAPSVNVSDGDLYYDSVLTAFRGRINGTWTNLYVSPYTTIATLGSHTSEPTGIENPSAFAAMTFTDSNRTFSCVISGTANIWSKGTLYTKTGTITQQITNTIGLHFLYYNSSGNFVVVANSPWDLTQDIPVALVYWDGTKGILYDERHGITMDGTTHLYLHETLHTQYVSGIEIRSNSYIVNTATVSANTPGFTDGYIRDEDIKLAISGFDADDPGTVWTPFYRNNSLVTTWDVTPSQYMWKIVSNQIVYDASGVLTPVANNSYINIWILANDEYIRGDATYSTARKLIPIIGQQVYTSVANAQAATFGSEISIGTAPSIEWLPCYQITIQSKTADSGSGYARIAATIKDIRKVNNPGSAATGAGSHNTLSGRSDANCHPSTAISLDETSFTLNKIFALITPETNVQAGFEAIATNALARGGSNISTCLLVNANNGQSVGYSNIGYSNNNTLSFIGVDGVIDGSGTISIGSSNATGINIGRVGQSLPTLLRGDLQTTNKTLRFNVANGASAATGSGLKIEGDSSVDLATFLYDSSLTSKFKLGLASAEAEVATVSHQQTLTNKIYNGGTASATSYIKVPANTTTNLNGLSRVEGAFYYDSTQKIMVYDDGVVLNAVGSGSGGGLSVSNLTGTTVTVKKGYSLLSNGEVIIPDYTAGNPIVVKDYSLNLSSLVATPLDNTTYYLYIDRSALPAVSNIANGLKATAANSASYYALLTSAPDSVDPGRYVAIGWFHTADTGNSWTGSGYVYGSLPNGNWNLLRALLPSMQSVTYNSAGIKTFLHNIGIPDIIKLDYYDPTAGKRYPLDQASLITDKNATTITIDLTGFSFGAGDQVEITAIKYNAQENIITSANTFDSGWMTSNALSNVNHPYQDKNFVKNYEVLQYDVANNAISKINADQLVKWVTNAAFVLDWNSLSPSVSTYWYKIVASPYVSIASIPTNIGGFTKFVGVLGGYATLALALASAVSGDRIYVATIQYINAADLNIATADLDIQFAPGAYIEIQTDNKINISANNIMIVRPDIRCTGTTTTNALYIAADDAFIDNASIKSKLSNTITNAYNIASGNRNYINGKTILNSGAITNKIIDNGTDSDYSIRG